MSAGFYHDWGADLQRISKLATGEWQKKQFRKSRYDLRKTTEQSWVILPESEMGTYYKSPWTFLWLEEDFQNTSGPQWKWLKDAQFHWNQSKGVARRDSVVKTFFETEVFTMIKSAFLVYRREEFKKSRENGLLFQAWIDSLSFESFFEKVMVEDSQYSINIVIYLYSIEAASLSGWNAGKYSIEVGKLADQLGFIDYVKEKSGMEEEVSANEISDRGVESLSNEEKKRPLQLWEQLILGLMLTKKS